MLTLDQSTLFYFSLNSNPDIKRGIKSWASNVDMGLSSDHAKLNNRPVSSKAGSSKSVITSKSTLVDNVIISRKVAVNSRPDSPLSENFGGIRDEDETFGAERDAAISSPIKGRGRLTSSVNKY